MEVALHYGKILGNVVATKKANGMGGFSLKVLQPLNDSHEPVGEPIVAADELASRPGDFVLWVASREAALACTETFVPVDAAVVGLIDEGARS